MKTKFNQFTSESYIDKNGNYVSEEDEFDEFPYSKEYDYAAIYSKTDFIRGGTSGSVYPLRTIKYGNFDPFDEEEPDLKNRGYMTEEQIEEFNTHPIKSGTRVGVLDYRETDIETLIVFTGDSIFYTLETSDSMITDGTIIFVVGKNKVCSPAQEPVDLLESDFENGGGTRLENHRALRRLAQKFKLNHFLISV